MLKGSTSPRSAHIALDFVFKQTFEKDKEKSVGLATAMDPKVFKQERATGDQVILDQFMGGGLVAQRTNEEAEIQETNVRATNNQVLTVLEFADAVSVPKNFQDDEKHGLVRHNLTDMAYRMRETQDDYALDRWSLGFTTVVTNDAVAWFSNSHVRGDGGTEDNLETGVLTSANFETLAVRLGRQKNQGGVLGHFHASTLLVPYNLMKEACELVDSDLRYDTGNNAINYISRKYQGLEVKFSAVLDDTSTTAYFLASDRHSATRWVREDLQTNYIPWDISKSKVGTYQAWVREVANPISYEGSAASNGSV